MTKRLLAMLALVLPCVAQATNALHFDGIDDYVQTPLTAGQIGVTFTVEAWVNVSDMGDLPILSTASTNGNSGMELHLVAGTLSLMVRSSNDSWIEFNTGSTTLSGRTHVAASFNGSVATLFINGTSIIPTATMSGDFIPGSELLRIGSRAGGASPFKGSISEVQVWSVVRSAIQIQGDMNGYTVAQPNQLAYYKLNQGTVGGNNTGITTAKDLVSTAYNGTLWNFALVGYSSNWVLGRAMEPALPSGTGSSSTPYEIDSLPNLLWLSMTNTVWSAGNEFKLMKDIDASDTKNWAAGSGFSPIGNNAMSFDGSFYGNGKVITGLTINRPSLDSLGFFGKVGATGQVDSLGLQGATVLGRTILGALFGVNSGTVTNSFVTEGTVTSADSVQLNIGLFGGKNNGSISNCYARGTVSATGLKSGTLVVVGGLVANNSGSISRSYTMGSVTASSIGANADAGGMIGFNSGVVSHCFSMDTLWATASSTYAIAGGITAWNNANGKISNSYATGPIHTNGQPNAAGGIAGITANLSTIDSSYASGQLISSAGSNFIGGLVGFSMGGTTNASYWDKNTTGMTNAFGTTADPSGGMSTAEMMTAASFSNWDLANIWMIYEGHTYPLLREFMTPLTVTAKSTATKVYDKITPNVDLVTYVPSTVNSTLLQGSLGAAETAVPVGDYSINPSLLYSSQLGYLITPVGSGILTITAAPLTITGIVVDNKVYDGTTVATVKGASLKGGVAGDDIALTLGTASFATKDTGTAKPVTITGSILSGLDIGNYSLVEPVGLTANITPKSIEVTGVTASNKVYDGTTSATLSGGTLSPLTGDVVTLTLGTGIFANKNVGTAKTVVATGFAISGVDAGNYKLNAQPAGLKANITPKSIAIEGVKASNKVYDGTTRATLSSGTLTPITGDVVKLTQGTGTFDDKNVGTAKTVAATGFAITGADAGNYSLSAQPTGLKANITAYPITVTADAKSIKKGDANVALTFTADDLFGSDVFTGALTREIGDGVGTYSILQGTLSAGSNYKITFEGADYVIASKLASIDPIVPQRSFTGRANTRIFNLQGAQAWSGVLDVIDGRFAMPNVGAGQWVVKLQLGNTTKMVNTVLR